MSEPFKTSSPDGIVAEHSKPPTKAVLVAPATADQFNAVRPDLIATACCQLPDHHFDFDSSFIKPDSATAFRNLAKLLETHDDCPLSIFGHADPVGQDEYNKHLSGRRARAVFGLLTHDAAVWETLYTEPLGRDNWGTRVVQTLLQEFGFSPGPLDGKTGDQTKAAVREFQAQNGLAPDGIPGPLTRKKLFEAYMKRLWPEEVVRTETHFLTRDPGGKGNVQGCGEFNPLLIVSQEEQGRFSKPENKDERDRENAPNRRVIVYLFRPGTVVDPETWPCPRATEGPAGCRKRFWSDGEARRKTHLPTERREYEKTEDTFACRFYDRIAVGSPCESVVRLATLTLRLIDVYDEPLRNEPYTLEVAGRTLEGVTSDEGVLSHPIPADATTGLLSLDHWEFELTIADLEPIGEMAGAFTRLDNLEFFASRLEEPKGEKGGEVTAGTGAEDPFKLALMRFQHRHDLEPDGTLNEETVRKLEEVYGG